MPSCFIRVKYAVSDTSICKAILKASSRRKSSEHAKVALTNVSQTSEKILNEPMPVSRKTELLLPL